MADDETTRRPQASSHHPDPFRRPEPRNPWPFIAAIWGVVVLSVLDGVALDRLAGWTNGDVAGVAFLVEFLVGVSVVIWHEERQR